MSLLTDKVKLKVGSIAAVGGVGYVAYTEFTVELDISSLDDASYESTIEMWNEQNYAAFNIKELIVEIE